MSGHRSYTPGPPHPRYNLDEQCVTAIWVDWLRKSNNLTLNSHSLKWTCNHKDSTGFCHVGSISSRLIGERACCHSHRRINDDDDDVQSDEIIRHSFDKIRSFPNDLISDESPDAISVDEPI